MTEVTKSCGTCIHWMSTIEYYEDENEIEGEGICLWLREHYSDDAEPCSRYRKHPQLVNHNEEYLVGVYD